MKRFLILSLCIFSIIISVTACGFLQDGPPEPGENEILVIIRLDLDEDIGLLLIGSDINGENSSGGVSNADKTELGRGETLYWSIEKSQLEVPADTADVTLTFSVVAEYCDPNYDNIYPEELVIPANSVSFTSPFGETVGITVTGGRTSGYTATLD